MNRTFGKLLKDNVTSQIPVLVEIANACDRAYCEGINNAYGAHEPFDSNDPMKVAQNLAGLQAVVSSVGAIAELRNGDDYGKVLEDIANGNLSNLELNFTRRFANATWGACQAFRNDKGNLVRATGVNFYDDLPAEEVQKDDHQIRAAAKFLLERLY